MKLSRIGLYILLLVTLSALTKTPVSAACSFTRNTGTCTYAGATCSVNTSSTETYDCTVTEDSSTQNSVLSVGSGNITLLSGSTIEVGSIDLSGAGSIAASATKTINLSGSTAWSPLWVVDSDADGWSSNYNTTFTATASGRRRRSLMRGSTADCNDAAYSVANSCYSYSQAYYYSQGYYYGYGQGYYYGYGQGYYYGYGQGGYYSQGSYGYHVFWPGFSPN